MSRKLSILGLSLASVCGLALGSASASVLPGNIWPNPTLETAAPAGIDQVYSYYNGVGGGLSGGGTYTPYTSGDTNPRPNGWHRGNGDFGTTSTPNYTFWDSTPPTTSTSPPSGAALSGTHSLLVSDSDTNNSGEWFSDYNAIPVSSQGTGVPFAFRFNWEYTNVNSTQRPTDEFRVSVRWGAFASDDVMSDPSNTGGPDELIFTGSPDQTTWQQIDQLLIAPAGMNAMRVTIDSGGSSSATGQLWVDDVSIAAVPEPTSIGMLAGGALLLAKRRRRA
jgi:hypothetical protein